MSPAWQRALRPALQAPISFAFSAAQLQYRDPVLSPPTFSSLIFHGVCRRLAAADHTRLIGDRCVPWDIQFYRRQIVERSELNWASRHGMTDYYPADLRGKNPHAVRDFYCMTQNLLAYWNSYTKSVRGVDLEPFHTAGDYRPQKTPAVADRESILCQDHREMNAHFLYLVQIHLLKTVLVNVL